MSITSSHFVEVGTPGLQNLVKINLAVEHGESGAINIFLKRFESYDFGNTEVAVSAVAVGREVAKQGRRATLFDISQNLIEAANTFASRPLNQGLVRAIGVSIDTDNRITYMAIDGSAEMIIGRLG